MNNRFLNHYRYRLLLVSVVFVLIVLSIPSPPQWLELGTLLFMVLAGLNTVRSRSRWFYLVCLMGTVSLFTSVVPGAWHLQPFLARGVPQMLFILLLAASTFQSVTQQRPVTGELLYGLCALYLNFVLSFAISYSLIAHLLPNSFQTSNGPLDLASFVYFSMVTLTTIGYGDIVPVHPLARLLAGSEAIMGALFIALAVARGLNMLNDTRSD